MSPAGRHFGLLAVASAKRPEDVVDCAVAGCGAVKWLIVQ